MCVTPTKRSNARKAKRFNKEFDCPVGGMVVELNLRMMILKLATKNLDNSGLATVLCGLVVPHIRLIVGILIVK